jgi:RNA polymerase sigma-70 factor, ECF subfamily
MNNNWLNYIYKNLHRESYAWARQCCLYNDEYAKEVMQMVYLKLLEGKANYNHKATVKTWLFSVIRFTALDYLKQVTAHLNIDDVQYLMVEQEGKGEDSYEEVLSKLPPRQHQVLLLVFYHNLSLVEVAEVLNIGIGSVRTHYHRGKQSLRKLLTKEMAL